LHPIRPQCRDTLRFDQEGQGRKVEVRVRIRIALTELALLSLCSSLWAQVGENRKFQTPQPSNSQADSDEAKPRPDFHAEDELQKGTALTRAGSFAEAIPHLRAALGRVSNEYAAGFNLSLSLVATGQPKLAIPILTALRTAGHDNVDVNNLLAQAYIGDGQNTKALEAFGKASKLAPENEKLYLFVADACMEKQEYAVGLKVVNQGLDHLPSSAQLHYQRAMFLASLDELDAGKKDFARARVLAPDTDVAFLAGAQEAMLEGDVPKAVRIAREAVHKGDHDYQLLTLLGEALVRSGVRPGEAEFREAQQALEKAVAERPNYAGSQLAIGKLALLDHRIDDAIAHLETARELSPKEASVYSNLAAAYRRQGDLQKAQKMLAVLANLNQAQAEKFRSAPGDQKPGYAASGNAPSQAAEHP
jgi:tetratricopeptide (TPR) repeat protein